MATLLFHLGNVPDEEAEAVRRLLDEHGIATYETRAGFWGLGVAAIWLRDEAQREEARALIDAYQRELGERMRDELARLAACGEAPTCGDASGGGRCARCCWPCWPPACSPSRCCPFYGCRALTDGLWPIG